MTALDMSWQCDEDLDSEFQMLYRDEDFRIVPCFIADFTQLKFLSWCCSSFFFFFDLSLNLSSTYLIITSASRWCFFSFSLRWSCIIVMETLPVFLMQVKLAKSHSASYLAYGIQVQDEKCQEFFFQMSKMKNLRFF